MRLVTVKEDGYSHPGVLTDSRWIASLERWGHSSVENLIRSGPAAWAEVEREASGSDGDWPPDQPLRAPITRPPRNMFCVGLNYVTHYDEGDRSGVAMPDRPVFFSKPFTTLIGPYDDLVIDREATQKADWEAELAVVIGTGGVNIDESAALDHVFGYTLANDVSARDLQLGNGPFSQWHKGKSLDGFCPLGPHLVTVPAVGDLADLRIELTVNGTVKQDFRPNEMFHPIPKLISYLSKGMALLPGDVILTGTAAGVGHWHRPPEFLHGGDVVEIRCSALGTMRNQVVERGG